MANIWKSTSYLLRCDEEALRLTSHLKDWIQGINRLFNGFAEGIPHLQREIGEGVSSLKEMRTRISDDNLFTGENSPAQQINRNVIGLIAAHRRDQEEMAEFTRYFKVVDEVRVALGDLAELMEDVECFSVNAIVQAHNAGDRGRGFSQVSREVVGLTKRAALEFDHVRALAQNIDQELSELEAALDRSNRDFEQSPIQTEDEVNTLFNELEDARTDVVENVSRLIRGVSESGQAVGGMLVGLQFDDRCSQISKHLTQTLNQFHVQIIDLTQQDNLAPEGQRGLEAVMDAVWLGRGVFEVVEKLVEKLGQELDGVRTELASCMEGLANDMQEQGDATVNTEALETVIRNTQSSLEAFVGYMRNLVSAKGDIVSRAQALAGVLVDLRDDLKGVRRTAKRFGVMASIIKVELASAGLSEEFGDALSADRVEALHRDMASAVGSVLISLDTAVHQVQRASVSLRRQLVHEETMLRETEALAKRLLNDLEGHLIRNLNQGKAGFRSTLVRLNREAMALRKDASDSMELGRQSMRIRADARNRASGLEGNQAELLASTGLNHWEIKAEKVAAMLDKCTVHEERKVFSGAMDGGDLEEGDSEGELTLF